MRINRPDFIEACSGRFALRTQAQAARSSGWLRQNQSNTAIFCFSEIKHNPYRVRSRPINSEKNGAAEFKTDGHFNR
jgi:hypothetical protein